MSTPMMQQIAALKREAGDAVLTRMGDFYEIPGEDAVRAARCWAPRPLGGQEPPRASGPNRTQG